MSVMSSKKVLIVDDEPLLRWTLAEALHGWGYQAIEAGTVAQALSLFDAERPLTVLLDLNLPDGFGLEALREMKRRRPAVPVIVMTANVLAEELITGPDRAACDLLEKPVNLFQLRDLLSQRSAPLAAASKQTGTLPTGQGRDYASLLEHASDAVIVRDLQDRILYWNRGAERAYGWAATETLGQNIERLLYPHGASAFVLARRATLEQGEWRGELRQATKYGRTILSECHWTLVRDEAGQPHSIVVINNDITEKRRLETHQLRAQHLHSLDTFASGFAHSLSNLLTPVLTAVQLLQMKYSDEASQRMLVLLQANVERGAEMLRQLQVFTSTERGSLLTLQPGGLLTEVANTIRQTLPPAIVLRCQIAQGLGEISGDGAQLGQMLLSLCSNAVEAMPLGGCLTLAAEQVALDEMAVLPWPEAKTGHYARFSVSDTGVGIPPEIRERIFDPFFTTKGAAVGAGLGLATVLGIVRGHQGFIGVESEQGQGARFDIYLPLLDAPTLNGGGALPGNVMRAMLPDSLAVV